LYSKSGGLIDYWKVEEYGKLLKINLHDFDFSQGVNQKCNHLSLYRLQSSFCLNIFAFWEFVDFVFIVI
jgi:hypothetical protein